jgi:hypothetical protein
MSMVCALDLHRQQITFDARETETGEVWRGPVWQPDRERFRRWLTRDVACRANGQSVAMAVEGCTGWRYVVEEITAAGLEPHLAEPADTQAARGRKRHAHQEGLDSWASHRKRRRMSLRAATSIAGGRPVVASGAALGMRSVARVTAGAVPPRWVRRRRARPG